MDLNEIRKKIDNLDKQLLALFEERMELCTQVAQYKKVNNLPVFQGNRETEILERVSKESIPKFQKSSQKFFISLLDISKQLQMQLITSMEETLVFPEPHFETAKKVGCQGIRGANSETATQNFFPNRDIIFYPTFKSVFEAVEKGEIEYGVLPIYNSTTGSVTQTNDLMGDYNFFITAMNTVEVTNCIAVRPGITLEEITKVYSHPQALSQCSDFLKKHHLAKESYDNTATAAKMVSQSDEPFAAICSEECANLNGLHILERKISNVVPNYTKFICITKNTEVSPKASIISFMMKLANVPGSLSNILNKFFLQGLDLVKLESRPIQDGSFDVMFYVDFKGNLLDRTIAPFLNELCKSCTDFKLLGNSIVFS